MRMISKAFLTAALLAAGCSSSPKADSELELAQKSPHIAAIPSDTPYAFASLQPMPLGEAISLAEQLSPEIDKAAAQVEALASDTSASTSIQLIAAYLAEFKGKWNRAGFESLGFSMTPRTAFYGISWLPALRHELKDPAAVKALIERVEKRAGITGSDQKVGEYTYRAYPIDDGILAVAFQGKEIIMGYTPNAAAQEYIPYLVGEKKPASNLLQTKALEALTAKYGMAPYFLGFVDLERIVQMLIAPQPGLNEDISSKVFPTRNVSYSPTCQSEFRGLISKFPRFVVGTEWDADGFSATGGLEMTNGLGTKLASTRMPIPAAQAAYAENAVASFGIGTDVGALIQVGSEIAAAHRETPFQCEDLLPYNEYADQYGGMSMMLPAVVTQLRGVNVLLKSIDTPEATAPGPQDPSGDLTLQPEPTVTGAVVIETSNAAGLLDFLKLAVPELSTTAVQPNGVAVQVPEVTSLNIPPGNYFVAMSDTRIGLASGETAADDAAELSKASSGQTPWIALTYDPSMLLEMLGTVEEEVPEMYFQGPVRVEIEPNDNGVFFKYRQSFKPQ